MEAGTNYVSLYETELCRKQPERIMGAAGTQFGATGTHTRAAGTQLGAAGTAFRPVPAHFHHCVHSSS